MTITTYYFKFRKDSAAEFHNGNQYVHKHTHDTFPYEHLPAIYPGTVSFPLHLLFTADKAWVEDSSGITIIKDVNGITPHDTTTEDIKEFTWVKLQSIEWSNDNRTVRKKLKYTFTG